MQIPLITEFLILAQEGGENAAPAADTNAAPSILNSPMVLILGIFFIFWFLIIRPQSKKQKARERKVQSMQKGDTVLTHGGIYGRVVKLTDQDVILEVDKTSKTRIQFTRTAILDILDVQGGQSADSAAGSSDKEEAAAPSVSGIEE